jgi:hypothetical protein
MPRPVARMHPIVVVEMPHEIAIATSTFCGTAFVAELPQL